MLYHNPSSVSLIHASLVDSLSTTNGWSGMRSPLLISPLSGRQSPIAAGLAIIAPPPAFAAIAGLLGHQPPVSCNGLENLDKKLAFLKWWAALKMKESQCPERAGVTHLA
jgi:hypothetical protein